MSPRLAFAVETAVAAGRATLPYFQTGAGFEVKADASPVTAADRAAERVVRERLEAAYPGEAILGEEEGTTGEGPTRWVVDPIDGTKSFVAGVPLYATLLSFEEEGRPLVACAYFPALGELLAAERGLGATWNGRLCRVSAEKPLSQAVVCHAGLKSLEAEGRLAGLTELARQVMATRTWSDAYGHALVATGRVDAMVDPVLAPWDISAMSLIVEEAGGLTTDFGGQPGAFSEALSCAPWIQPTLLQAFARG